MPPFVLTVLKIALLVLLYFFVWRAVRAVVLDLYGGERERRPRAEPKQKQKQPRRGRGAPSKLVVLDERGRGATHRLAGAVEIGRDAGATIRPDDTYISQQHARVFSRNGTWVVEDLGSTNGTYLNQRKVTMPTEISPGDRIRVGKTVIEVRK